MTADQRPVDALPKVRIGIVSWNTADLLSRCLASLPAAASGLDVEVIVVDNASSDNSAEIAESHSGVRVIRNQENLGYAKAMNQALLVDDGAAGIDVLIALNPDTESPPGSLTSLVEALRAAPTVGIIVPRLAYSDGQLQHSVYHYPGPRISAATGFTPRWVLRRWLGEQLWLEGFARHDRTTDVDWAIGAVHVIRSTALNGDRPYNERWFMYVEDLDLCWRLNHSGWLVRFTPEITITHIGNAAGEQAWGTSRSGRWLDATYDWYRLRHGTLAMWWWALANSLAATALLIPVLLKRLVGRPVKPWDRELTRALPHHLRAVVHPRKSSAKPGINAESS